MTRETKANLKVFIPLITIFMILVVLLMEGAVSFYHRFFPIDPIYTFQTGASSQCKFNPKAVKAEDMTCICQFLEGQVDYDGKQFGDIESGKYVTAYSCKFESGEIDPMELERARELQEQMRQKMMEQGFEEATPAPVRRIPTRNA